MPTDAEHAAVLRRYLMSLPSNAKPEWAAAVKRAIELLERETRMEGTDALVALKRQDAFDDGIIV